jgi:hypothetical protein
VKEISRKSGSAPKRLANFCALIIGGKVKSRAANQK